MLPAVSVPSDPVWILCNPPGRLLTVRARDFFSLISSSTTLWHKVQQIGEESLARKKAFHLYWSTPLPKGCHPLGRLVEPVNLQIYDLYVRVLLNLNYHYANAVSQKVLKPGLINQANGSAYIETGRTKVACAVYIFFFLLYTLAKASIPVMGPARGKGHPIAKQEDSILR